MTHSKLGDVELVVLLLCGCSAGSDVTDDHQIPDGSHAITSTSPLMIIESFLVALTNVDQDGRIVVTRKKGLVRPVAIL